MNLRITMGWSLFVLVAACGGKETTAAAGSAAPSSKPAVSAKPAPAASSGGESSGGSNCEKFCDKSLTCGMEMAEELAKAGGDAMKAKIEDAKKKSEAAATQCREGCSKGGGMYPPEAMKKLEACVDKDCKAFLECTMSAMQP